MKRVVRATGSVLAIAFVLALAATYLPPVIWPDAAAPQSVAVFVSSARTRLWNEATDDLKLPLHLTFVEARCASNGSVALIFEEHRPPYTQTRYGYVARGSMPAGTDDGWSGGVGLPGPVVADDEFIHLMGPNPPHVPDPQYLGGE